MDLAPVPQVPRWNLPPVAAGYSRIRMGVEELQAAWDLLKEAYQYQMGGDYDMAVELYKRSLDLHPTAEAFTFLVGPIASRAKSKTPLPNAKRLFSLIPNSAPLTTISALT